MLSIQIEQQTQIYVAAQADLKLHVLSRYVMKAFLHDNAHVQFEIAI